MSPSRSANSEVTLTLTQGCARGNADVVARRCLSHANQECTWNGSSQTRRMRTLDPKRPVAIQESRHSTSDKALAISGAIPIIKKQSGTTPDSVCYSTYATATVTPQSVGSDTRPVKFRSATSEIFRMSDSNGNVRRR